MDPNQPYWRDPFFLAAAEAVQGYSLMAGHQFLCDPNAHLFMLWTLVGEAARGGDLIEVGCWRGGSGCVIASRARYRHSDATVYLCDTFEGIVDADPAREGYRNGEFADTSIDCVRGLADRMDLTNVEIIAGRFPDKMPYASAKTISFAHIDCDSGASAQASFEWIWPRVIPGGIVIFDDYGDARSGGLTEYVNSISGYFWFIPSPMHQAIFIRR